MVVTALLINFCTELTTQLSTCATTDCVMLAPHLSKRDLRCGIMPCMIQHAAPYWIKPEVASYILARHPTCDALPTRTTALLGITSGGTTRDKKGCVTTVLHRAR